MYKTEHTTKISAIAAIGENRELGKDNELLWHIPGELPRFKKITMGHPIIMGRKTFESIGRVLPGRLNVIITRDKKFTIEGAVVCFSLEEAIKVSKEKDQNEIFILGGGQIFQQAMSLIDRVYLTIVHQAFPDADVFFPEYAEFTKVIQRQEQEGGGYRYTFLTLER